MTEYVTTEAVREYHKRYYQQNRERLLKQKREKDNARKAQETGKILDRSYLMHFTAEWEAAVKRLRCSGVDLGRIVIVSRCGGRNGL